MTASKITWSGEVISVQPRVRLNRSFDQRSHSYPGYVLGLRGYIGGERREFTIALGQGAHAKHQFRIGFNLGGQGAPVADPQTETAELYKISKLEVLSAPRAPHSEPPPWHGIPPELPTYRARGHRRLAAHTYDTHCSTCIWACNMVVKMTVDPRNPRDLQYRTETFCYGPLSCPLYQPGPNRKVPGRNGLSYTEPDEVDADAAKHRGPDE